MNKVINLNCSEMLIWMQIEKLSKDISKTKKTPWYKRLFSTVGK